MRIKPSEELRRFLMEISSGASRDRLRARSEMYDPEVASACFPEQYVKTLMKKNFCKERERGDGKRYAEKLKDVRWQKVRLEIMQRDGWKCIRCKTDEKTLNVHHIKYNGWRDPWDYPPEKLQTLCEDCHGLLKGLRNGSIVFLPDGGFEHFGGCPNCGSREHLEDHVTYDDCLRCGFSTSVFLH